jgi:molecular chaperone GrpE
MRLGRNIDNLTFVPIFTTMKDYNNDDPGQEDLEDMNTDENIAGATRLEDDIAAREEEFERLKDDLQEQKDKYLRLLAEFDNFRRRNARENLELRSTAGKEIIVSLLDVLDDCDRAEKQLDLAGGDPTSTEGVRLVFSKLRSVLQGKGLKPMQSIGMDFDVEKHEAITEVPVQDPALKGKVIDEVKKGYYLNDKIIRFAKVVVGK